MGKPLEIDLEHWLTELLAPGPLITRELKAAAASSRIGWRTLNRFTDKHPGVVKVAKLGMAGPWCWTLPGQSRPEVTAEECQAKPEECQPKAEEGRIEASTVQTEANKDTVVTQPEINTVIPAEVPAPAPAPPPGLTLGQQVAIAESRGLTISPAIYRYAPTKLYR